jgi:hypothetical protein
MQERPFARILYALTALSAFTGIAIAYVIAGAGSVIVRVDTPGLFDDYGQDAVGRLADLSCSWRSCSRCSPSAPLGEDA